MPSDRWKFRDASADWMADSVLGWKQKEMYQATNYDLGSEPVIFKTNVHGFRPNTVDPAMIDTSDFVVFLVGNSTVNGRSVPESQTLHFYLDSLLTSAGLNTKVVNASVQGYSTDQSLLMIRAYAKFYKPDWIIYGFCDNDLGGNELSKAYGLNKPRFELTGEELHFKSLNLQNTDFTKFREPSWKDLIVKSALFRLIRPLIISLSSRNKSKNEQILVGVRGADYYFNSDKIEVFNWALLEALLIEMDRESYKVGAKFLFYCHPSLESVWTPYQNVIQKNEGRAVIPKVIEDKLQRIADKNGLNFIPMVDYFSRFEKRGPFHLLPRDTHCNGTGYLLQAEQQYYFLTGN